MNNNGVFVKVLIMYTRKQSYQVKNRTSGIVSYRSSLKIFRALPTNFKGQPLNSSLKSWCTIYSDRADMKLTLLLLMLEAPLLSSDQYPRVLSRWPRS
jgi:hypothetical protein